MNRAFASVVLIRSRRNNSVTRPRNSALRWLVSHHLGHALGVPAFSRQETVQRRGLEMHCTHAGCAMRHASTLEELAELALVEEVRDWPYCPACTHDLLTVLVRHTHAWS